MMSSEKVKLESVEPKGFYDKGVIVEDGSVQSKIDMAGWNLEAEKQAIEKKIAEAKKKAQIAKTKPFKGQKRKQVPINREREVAEKPKKKRN